MVNFLTRRVSCGSLSVQTGTSSLRSRTQHGASMTEFIIALPMFVLLIFIIAEFSLMYQAKLVLDVASLAAARMGAVSNGNAGKMESSAVLALAPLYTHEPGKAGLMKGLARAELDARLPRVQGTTDFLPQYSDVLLNGVGVGVGKVVKVDVLSPTAEMMRDFGFVRDGVRLIPNDNLMYRSTELRNGVNIQDANLLKIRLTYLYELKMPLTRFFFTPLMDANVTRRMFGVGGPALPDALGGYRVPLVSYATVRMQSDFHQSSLSSGSSSGGSGGGGSSGNAGGDGGTGGNDDDDGNDSESGGSGGSGGGDGETNPDADDGDCTCPPCP